MSKDRRNNGAGGRAAQPPAPPPQAQGGEQELVREREATPVEVLATKLNVERELVLTLRQEIILLRKENATLHIKLGEMEMVRASAAGEESRAEYGIVVGKTLVQDKADGKWYWLTESPAPAQSQTPAQESILAPVTPKL